MVPKRTKSAKTDMFGRPIQGSSLTPSRTSPGIGASPDLQRRALPASLPRWTLPLVAVLVVVVLFAVAPRVAAVLGIITVLTGFVYLSLRASRGQPGYHQPNQTGRFRSNRDYLEQLRGYWAPNSTDPSTRRVPVQELSNRAAQLEQAAQRFKLAGDEKMAASFASEAAELRRRGA